MRLARRAVWKLFVLLICAAPCTVAGDDWESSGGWRSDRRASVSEAMTSPSSLTGRWEGTWHRSESSAGGSLRALLTQVDSSLVGEVEILDAGCLSGGTVSGSVNGATVVFGVVSADAVQAEFMGSVVEGGLAMEGSYKVIAGKCMGDIGTWNIVKIIEPCDANGDGKVDRQDARDLLNFLLGGGGALSGNADCHQDGVLNFRDVIAILKAAAM
jgi:hypothetical protein